MPEISEAAGYLVALLHSAGVATPTGMGLTGLSWQEIESWARCNDFVSLGNDCECSRPKGGMRSRKKRKEKKQSVVGPRELRAIWRLSRAYTAEYVDASKKGAKPPYMKVDEGNTKDEVEREMISDKADDVFGMMLAAQNERG